MIFVVVVFNLVVLGANGQDDDYRSNEAHLEVRLDERNLGEMKSVCQNFSFGNVYTGEFSTPNYPDTYPANIECVRVIHAPPHHFIHLDFRGATFEIERSESTDKCEYDYLEVRNGPYGFSPLIGKFCGKRYPPVIIADAGSMWLHFKSDKSIQYKGFKALHYFSPMKEDAEEKIMCSFSNDMMDDDGVFSTDMMRDALEQIFNETRQSAECIWKLETSSAEQKLRIKFDEFELAFPNECDVNVVQIYGGNTAYGHHLKQFCGRSASMVVTNRHTVYIRIKMSRGAMLKTKIRASYTVYVPGKNCSSEGMFQCGDDTCISTRLVCNGRSNCVSDSDEKKCPVPPLPSFREVYGAYLVILIVILVIIAIIVTCIAIMNLCPRFKKSGAAAYAAVPNSISAFSQNSTATTLSNGTVVGNSIDVVYSTVVPAPNHNGRLYELLPKMSSEDLHVYMCKQGCRLNGPNEPVTDGHLKSSMSSNNNQRNNQAKNLRTFDAASSSTGTPPISNLKKPKPDLILNGLMSKKKMRSYDATVKRGGAPPSKTVKFFRADSIDDASSDHTTSPPMNKVAKTSSNASSLSLSPRHKYRNNGGSSTDTLENLSQTDDVNRLSSDDDDSTFQTVHSPKSPVSDDYVISI